MPQSAAVVGRAAARRRELLVRVAQTLLIASISSGAAVGCAPSIGDAGDAAALVDRLPNVRARARSTYRPRHQGGADVSTGVYTRQDDDLAVSTPFPIVLRRTYLSGDHRSRQFGVGGTHPGEWWLHGDGDPRVPWADMILADGGRIHFTRITPGIGVKDAVLRHDSTPTEFNGALLTWASSRWTMEFENGATAVFLDCQGKRDVCSLVERRDPSGHRIEYVRNEAGTLLRMESDGQSIALDYDDKGRITRARDSGGHSVSYAYDGPGRLVRAEASDGTVRSYGYNDRDELTEIREPGRIMRNWFDGAGRFSRQEVRNADDDPDPYVITARYVVERGSIVEADVDEGNGLRRYRYNGHHYIVSETIDADSEWPVTFTYSRDATTNIVNTVSLTCVGPAGTATRTVPVAANLEDSVKAALVHEMCATRRR